MIDYKSLIALPNSIDVWYFYQVHRSFLETQENFLLIVSFEDIIPKVEGKLIFITFLSWMVAANIVVMVINLMVAVYIKIWTRCNVYICYDNKI